MEPSWTVLGPSLAILNVLNHLSTFLVPSWGCLEASWGRLGAILDRLGALLGVSWGVLASFLEGFWVIFKMTFQYFSYLIFKDVNTS